MTGMMRWFGPGAQVTLACDPPIERLRGLAELRGLERGIAYAGGAA